MRLRLTVFLQKKYTYMDNTLGISSVASIRSQSESINLIFSSNSKLFTLQILSKIGQTVVHSEQCLDSQTIETLYNLKMAEHAEGWNIPTELVCLDENGNALMLETIEQILLFKDYLLIAAGSLLYSSQDPLQTNATTGEYRGILLSILGDFKDEEINDMCSNDKDKIMLSFDSGIVRWLEVHTTKDKGIQVSRKVVSKDQHGVMANVVALRPTLPWHAISGGFDSKLFHWDASKGICKYSHDFAVNDIDTAFCNPPHVHSLAVSPSGNRVASGLANGRIIIMSLSRTLKSVPSNTANELVLDGHSWTVSQLLFLKEDLLLSASIDESICIWKLEASRATVQATIKLDFKINSISLIDRTWSNKDKNSNDRNAGIVAVGGAGKGALSIIKVFY